MRQTKNINIQGCMNMCYNCVMLFVTTQYFQGSCVKSPDYVIVKQDLVSACLKTVLTRKFSRCSQVFQNCIFCTLRNDVKLTKVSNIFTF